MAASKYERELRFIQTETDRLNAYLRDIAEDMPADPAEARAKAEKVQEIHDKIANMQRRRAEIENSYVEAGMDIPNIRRSMNATVHNAGAFEILDQDEAETKAGLKVRNPATADDLSSEIKGIGSEIAQIEDRIVEAEIDGDEAEAEKLRMMVSTLRSRRETLVQQAREMREAAARAPAAAEADGKSDERISALEEDNKAIRAQISDLRSGMQDMKESLRQIMAALGIDED